MAFDTRIRKAPAGSFLIVKIFGYAAQPLAKSLAQAGGAEIVQPEGFAVTGREDPLQTASWSGDSLGAADLAKA